MIAILAWQIGSRCKAEAWIDLKLLEEIGDFLDQGDPDALQACCAAEIGKGLKGLAMDVPGAEHRD